MLCSLKEQPEKAALFYGMAGTLLVYMVDMSTKPNSLNIQHSSRKALLGVAVMLMLASLACVRSATVEDSGVATEKSAETADAEIQATLSALLGSATVENAPATATATPTVQLATATPTVDEIQLAQLAGTLTAAVISPTAELTEEASITPTAKPTSAGCYAARYVYDETYPDGTRVNPGESMQKTWRLQNVGTCDWVAGQYELVFVSGERMSGQSPLTINITVPAGGYANFSINLKAPVTPGTYHGDWVLRLKASGDTIGVGPNSDQPFWIEIIVRGATPTP